MTSRAENTAYQRGYYAAANRRWHPHKPPLPPEPVFRELMEAVAALRDQADIICATFDAKDDIVLQLGPAVDAVDAAMIRISEWLAKPPDQVKAE